MNSSMSSIRRPSTLIWMTVSVCPNDGCTEPSMTSGGSVSSMRLKNSVHENVR